MRSTFRPPPGRKPQLVGKTPRQRTNITAIAARDAQRHPREGQQPDWRCYCGKVSRAIALGQPTPKRRAAPGESKRPPSATQQQQRPCSQNTAQPSGWHDRCLRKLSP